MRSALFIFLLYIRVHRPPAVINTSSPDSADAVMSNNSLSLSKVLEEYGKLFYIIQPGKNSFPSVEAVPDYVQQAMPYMVTLIVLEVGLDRFKEQK